MVIYEAEDRNDEGAKIHKKTSAASGAIGSTPSIGGLLCCSSPQRNLHTGLANLKRLVNITTATVLINILTYATIATATATTATATTATTSATTPTSVICIRQSILLRILRRILRRGAA